MKYKNLFIDLDDTLWDTYHNNKECLKEVYVDYLFDQQFDSFEAFYDVYMPHNLQLWAQYRNHEIDRNTLIVERFRYILRFQGIEDVASALRLNDDFLKRTTTKTRLIPGAVELLEYLRPSYKLYILSNGFREVQFLKLSNSGLASFFDRMILSEDANIQKPHKEIFDYALINTNSRRSETLMIGDSWDADIVGAHNAKIDQLWLNPEGLAESGFTPTYTVRSLAEIKQFL
ncbi:putative hydrolase of the HAD superfamily [Parabacteroides sp. PF5-5]|uniref:YjjG family noncanonical pyrimidine nucleotidase n=1 Tax=unclassified Parabacteroides TaxID=2649774 RepID=UPI0024742C53|nr:MULTISPECIES: YjjG family noncanonical pyrimidine nucleotidase [unclassified Parabacteroides]MDH6306101.1 putative hydrolase of the HAD superfamily [Parabacteroides sp. PH5-39]MDH6317001.1 putative hydrolase of the HAD superfamily [Parabacteroides sp. PF5-13]MDH6320754.1 putative hydrolase of the HAD superfamily [Parabacteroides sp. PH5-13]MDH6324544.1 putative hydrolase of the HAD superfamily [Parabacteroides sp. PH5-8]MDH6328186.1 putative hydrolase of the HAD superfamily [Parabacteroides